MSSNQEYIDILAEELKRGKLVIFVGAGVSIPSNLPKWSKLVEKFSDKLNIKKESDSFTPEEYLRIPQMYYNKFGKIEYYNVLNEVFNVEMTPNKIHIELEKLKPNYFITTNYDPLLEKQVNKDGKYDVIVREEELAYSKTNRMIIKMHGEVEAKNIVLKEEDYISYEKERPLITTYIKSLFTTNTILFIGYSLNDVNIQNIMKWIKEILKENFRRVYLTDLAEPNILNEYENDKNKLVNRIFLGNNTDDSKEDLVVKFLKRIEKTKNELKEKPKGRFYKRLNYIVDKNLELFKFKYELRKHSYEFSEIDFNIEKSMLSQKEINLKEEDLLIFYKNKIKKIYISNESNEEYKEKNLKEENYYKEREKEEQLIKKVNQCILSFNYKELKMILCEEDLENKQLEAYCYFLLGEYSKAKKKLLPEIYIKNEMKIWHYYVIHQIEKLEKNRFILDKEREYYDYDLKNEYNILFNNIDNDLYEEIINAKTIKGFNDKIYKLKEKIREDKRSIVLGISAINQLKYSIREFLNYSYLNGYIIEANYQSYEIFKSYLEGIFISYTQDKVESRFKIGESNKILDIDYITVFIILKMELKNLMILFEEYKIKKIKLDKESKEIFLNFLENIIENINEKDLEIVTYFIWKLEVNTVELKKIISQLNKIEVLEKLNSEGLKYYSLLLNECYKKLDKNDIKNIIEVILKIKNRYLIFRGVDLIGLLTFIGEREKVIIKNIDLFDDFIGNNNLNDKKEFIYMYFTRIGDDRYKSKVKNMIKKQLEEKFEIELYLKSLELKILEKKEEYEEKIFESLNSVFNEKNKKTIELNPHNYMYLVESIIVLNANELSTGNFKEKLKKLDNEVLIGCLKKQNNYNIWNYFLDKENFDLEELEFKDLKRLTEEGLDEILKQDSENKVLNLLKEQLNKEYDDNFLKVLLKRI